MPTFAERRAKLIERNKQMLSGKTGQSNTILNLSKYDKVPFYSPKNSIKITEGVFECHFDIIPFIISNDKYPGDMPVGYEDYCIVYPLHGGLGIDKKGMAICLTAFKKHCPVCEERTRLNDAGNEKEASQLNYSRRIVLNVIDLMNKPKGVQIFNTSYVKFYKDALLPEITIYAKKLGKIPEEITLSDIEQGLSVECRATTKIWNKREYFEYSNFIFTERDDPYTEKIYEDAYPLDVILEEKSYDEVNALMLGTSVEEKEEPAKRKTKSQDYGSESDIHNMNVQELRRYIKKNSLDVKVTREMNVPQIVAKIEDVELKNESSDCPNGHVWGADCDTKDECTKCLQWEPCMSEFEKLELEASE